ncbi:bacteria Hypothetical protein protein [Nesidiocoris tenuis]|uniref:Beta-1,3-glucan-binding protein n=1 Tax=Nesidiocoris tenuis TaxID=355587 RepID=A0ABN7AL02_9HEMI|nr:bacteria Hypothetical protein protein [Nesidiocoris tenuis]
MHREWLVRLPLVCSVLVFFFEGTDGLKYLACFKENSITDRLLKGAQEEFRQSLSPDICMSFCKTKGMRYFGLEYSFECFCSNERPSLKNTADEDECDMKCEGNPRETCGGALRISVYDSEEDLSNVRYIGCYKEKSAQARLMTGAQKDFQGSLTNQKCIDYCKERHFSYAATQFKYQCFCSNERPHFKSSAEEDECNQPCDGNSEETCGGGYRLSVYDLYDTSTDNVFANYMGCYSISPYQRDLLPNRKDYFKQLLTPEYCVGYCYRKGLRFAGMAHGSLCFCGNQLEPNNRVSDRQCDVPCSGDSKLKCGGTQMITMYHTEISDQSEEGKLLGCFEDNGNLRVLSGLQITFKETNTPRLCLNVCLQLGFKFAGVQYGVECFCGNRPPMAESERSESECSLPCPGDRLKMCGGGWRLLVFNTGKNTSIKPASVLLNARPTVYTPTATTTTQRPTTTVTTRRSTVTTRRTTSTETTRRPQTQQFGTAKPQTNPWLSNQGTTTPNPWVNQGAQTTTPQPQNPWVSNQGTQTNFNEENTSNKKPGYNPQQQQRPTGNNQQAENQYQQGGSALQGENPWQQENNQYQSGLITNQQISGSNNQQKPNTPPTDFETLGAADRTTSKPTCVRSVTEVKGENVCRGQVLFHDDFSEGSRINKYKWTHEVIMPWTPDYEFVVYQKSNKNSFLRNQKLFIKPTLLNDDFVKRGLLELESCTGLLHSEECRRQGATYNIIPPIESARLTTKDTITFKYGKVQIRAKLPVGDWIVPEIWLEPKRKDYGTGAYASGRVRIAMARGNPNLEYDGRDIGSRQLEVGILMGVDENIRARTIIRDKVDGWWRSFHNYTLIWTPDNLQFLVDGQYQESIVSPGRPLYQLAGFDDEVGETWSRGSLIAPFDKEFYVTLGLSVGGMRDFPDECRSSGHAKPWRNMAVKAMASFWEDRQWWQRTWDEESSALQVESVTITAL